MVERGDPSRTKEMGCQLSTPRVHGFQTCRPFVASALNSPTEPSGVHYSRTIGEVSIWSADTSSTFGNREKTEKNKTGTVVWVDVYGSIYILRLKDFK